MKTCGKCGKRKPLGDYYRDSRSKDGRSWRCKKCTLTAVKLYREENKGLIAAKKRLEEKTSAGKARIARYRASEKAKTKARAAEAAARQNLSDGYVKRCIAGTGRRTISAKGLPAELVALKREQISVVRALRKLESTLKEMP